MMIDLVLCGPAALQPDWSAGQVHRAPGLAGLEAAVERLKSSPAECVLFWHGLAPLPSVEKLKELAATPADVWHAGLKWGMGGLPGTMDFVSPAWMLNRDPDLEKESTSWRMSFNACLVRTDVLRKMGGPRPAFSSLEAAALETGHRWMINGVFMRHVPSLMPSVKPSVKLSFADELRFIFYRFGLKWGAWALLRSLLTGYAPVLPALEAAGVLNGIRPPEPRPYERLDRAKHTITNPRITVIVPTLDRYPYLRKLLGQFAKQTLPCEEIILADQTPKERRDLTLASDFSSLPLKILYQDEPGQCASRNAAIRQAQGDYLLFVDDDDEIPADLLEKHIKSLERFGCRVSSGVAYETGISELPAHFKLIRVSDVFPTNNTLIAKDVLAGSGLFDLAYNRKARADGDLGMRVYLSGESMILNPDVSVVHHHAPQGGLRAHSARVNTYAASRSRLDTRHLASDSEIYLWKRYFTPRQVREALWLQAAGTFALHEGSGLRKLLKVFWSLRYLPDTLKRLRENTRSAEAMLKEYPKIPRLENAHA